MGAFDNWDWEEFAGGIAGSIGPGVSTGINLRQAARNEEANRLKFARESPSVMAYLRGGYDQPAPEPPPSGPVNTSFGSEAAESYFGEREPTFGLGVTGAPGVELEPVTPMEAPVIDLGQAREARDRERATRMLAFSPETKKFVEGLRDREKRLLIAEENERQAEVKAGAVKDAAAKYHTQHIIVQRAMQELDELDKQEAQADTQAERIAIRKQMTKIRDAADVAAPKVQEAMEALMNLGAEDKDFEVLRVPGQYNTGLQTLINKLTGVSRVRAPGARSIR